MSGAILFDLDGTLIDSVPTIVKCYIKVGNKMGVKVDAKLAHKIIGGSAEITISRLFKREDIIQECSKMVREEYSKIWKNEVKPYPDVYTTLEIIRRMGIRMAVISSNSRSMIEQVLQHFNFLSFMDTFVSNEEVKQGKPAPDIVLEAMKRLNVPAEKCVVVGDTLFDIESGKRAGTHAILVVRKPICLAQSKYIPDYVISSLRDIISVIKNLVK